MKNSLQQLAHQLAEHPAVREKALIEEAYRPATCVSGNILIGDDAAAIPDPETGGHLLFAAEGIIDSFVKDDPWFAGYSAVMVNLSDIAAMGGRPIAITDILWTPDHQASREIWAGMQAASKAYQVPIVGGHTTHSPEGGLHLAAAVMGRAGKRLLTSFDAEAGDELILAIDMRGAYRGDKPFWNASTTTPADNLQTNLSLLPTIAEAGLACTAKDISNGGIIGTLAMLCHCSQVGAQLDLTSIPKPDGSDWLKWLTSFPSYGYLLTCKNAQQHELATLFQAQGITVAHIGMITEGKGITLRESNSQKKELIPLTWPTGVSISET